MDFDSGDCHSGNRISKGDAGMGVSSGIQDNHVKTGFSFLNPAYQLSFLVGLAEINFGPKLFGALANLGFDFRQRRPAINIRLALPEQVQIRPVEKENFHKPWPD